MSSPTNPNTPLRPPALTLWFTGLSGAGKSTLACATLGALEAQGKPCFLLDGDDLRQGLNRDLGFTAEDRSENLRRAAEVAKLFNRAGITVLAAFITPFAKDRASIASIVGPECYREVHVSTPLEVCESRDPKGLYAKARRGEIKSFTGVSDPFESPAAPDLRINTHALSLDESVQEILTLLSHARPR
jgi:adenylylsulfate kinase